MMNSVWVLAKSVEDSFSVWDSLRLQSLLKRRWIAFISHNLVSFSVFHFPCHQQVAVRPRGTRKMVTPYFPTTTQFKAIATIFPTLLRPLHKIFIPIHHLIDVDDDERLAGKKDGRVLSFHMDSFSQLSSTLSNYTHQFTAALTILIPFFVHNSP